MALPRTVVHPRGMPVRGYSLLELLIVLSISAVLLAAVAPPFARWRDGAAVRAAREEIASAFAYTRLAAAAHGGAELLIDPVTARVATRTGGQWRDSIDLGHRYGVRISLGAATPAVFRYDALGIGRATSRTIRVERGGVVAGVTVSAYGRYRRW